MDLTLNSPLGVFYDLLLVPSYFHHFFHTLPKPSGWPRAIQEGGGIQWGKPESALTPTSIFVTSADFVVLHSSVKWAQCSLPTHLTDTFERQEEITVLKVLLKE